MIPEGSHWVNRDLREYPKKSLGFETTYRRESGG